MLKAVRFNEDNEEHKKLLDFIESFYDSGGKLNESEGIRHLMKLGLNSLNKTIINTDLERIKSELLDELLTTVNSNNDNLLKKISNLPAYRDNSIHNNVAIPESCNTESIPVIQPEVNMSKKVVIPGNSNMLLNNLLNNSNR